MDTDPREVQLAYVSRYRNAFRGRYLEDGEYRNGPVFQTEDEATFWAQRKREELERRASGETQHLPRGFYKTIPLHEGGARAGAKLPFEVVGRPGGNWLSFPRAPLPSTPPEPGEPALVLFDEPGEALAPATQAPGVPHASHAALDPRQLELLDGVVHDFVASLDEGAAALAEGTSAAHAARFLRLLEDSSSIKSRVLGPPILFGASPCIGLESLLGFLGSLRKTGILRVQADGVLFMVSIVKGDVVHGVSYPRPEPELLGNLLVARGTIDAAALARFLEEHASAPRIAQALERQALVSTCDLREALQHQLQLLFDRLLATRSGEWCFHEGEASLAYIDLRVNMISVLLESARKCDERGGTEPGP